MLESITKPRFIVLQRKLTDEGETFSGVYIEIRGKDVDINMEGVAREAVVEVGQSPTLTRSIEIRAKVGDKLCTICLTHEIVEMIEEVLCRR